MVKEGLINLDFADVRAVMRGMGKAMMGTGEASGEDRARHAAEAAIANPLLDDVSMHGARGLLISITGGPDLTLYEVDEAASRIREEVDTDANIILGATFDSSLNGTIRVSVVATGTDATMVQAMEPVKANPQRAVLVKRPHVPHQDAAPQQPAAQRPGTDITTQVQAAVADAITSRPAAHVYDEEDDEDGIHVEPYTPSASHNDSLYDDTGSDTRRIEESPVPSVYVPSHAERPEGRGRVVRTEELPAVARRSLDGAERADAEPRNARALFKRLASNVGLNMRPGQEDAADETSYSSVDDAAARSAIEQGGSRTSVAIAGVRGVVDGHGRQAAHAPAKEQLEIPAFLRKHA